MEDILWKIFYGRYFIVSWYNKLAKKNRSWWPHKTRQVKKFTFFYLLLEYGSPSFTPLSAFTLPSCSLCLSLLFGGRKRLYLHKLAKGGWQAEALATLASQGGVVYVPFERQLRTVLFTYRNRTLNKKLAKGEGSGQRTSGHLKIK
jgi:hypothetical protein